MLDSLYVGLSRGLHALEEVSLPLPSSNKILAAGVIAVPIVVLLNDTADYWMPKQTDIPILSWFARRWTKSKETKALDISIARNLFLFTWIAASLHENPVFYTPLDYVSDRLTSSAARRQLTNSIVSARTDAFAAATEALGQSAFDEAKARQQRDSALRRRHVQEST